MGDTSPEIEDRFFEMIMKVSGQERMNMGFSMFNMARLQVIASINMDKPRANLDEIRREIFLRFYGNDFCPQEQERILISLCSTTPSPISVPTAGRGLPTEI